MASPILEYFAYQHLPPALQEVSKQISDVALAMDGELPDGEEKAAGLRKLLEAKDCFVRCAIKMRRPLEPLQLSATEQKQMNCRHSWFMRHENLKQQCSRCGVMRDYVD